MGIFDSSKDDLFTTYRVTLQFRNRVVGGVPKDAEVVEGWLRTKMGITDEQEVIRLTQQTLEELGVEQASPFDLSEEIAEKKGNGFKSDERGLYLEGRCVKAMLKEVTNILYSGDKWARPGQTKGKSPKGFVAERVFVVEDKIHLGVKEASGTDLFIGHVTGRDGPRSTLTLYDYVDTPAITFHIKVVENSVGQDKWPRLWLLAQENGLGSMRSQGYGRFDIIEWETVDALKPLVVLELAG